MLLYVIRHGETEANKEGRFQGWSDNPLNEKGKELAVVTGRGMQGIRFDGCFSSPLIRARQTAQIILRESKNLDVPILIDERIKENGKENAFGPICGVCQKKRQKCFLTGHLNFPGFREERAPGRYVKGPSSSFGNWQKRMMAGLI